MPEGTLQPDASLLWRGEPVADSEVLGEHAAIDLGIEFLVEQVGFQPHLRRRLQAILRSPLRDPEEIRYRQEILEDCLSNPALLERVRALLPRLAHLGYLSEYAYHTTLEQVTVRLGELEIYIECVGAFKAALEDSPVSLHSAGLRELHRRLSAFEASPEFQDLAVRLPEIRKRVSGLASVTIGVNLDHQLHPFEATLLSLNDRPFTGTRDTFLSRLFGTNGDPKDEYRGIARLHSVPADFSDPVAYGTGNAKRPSPLIIPLFQDLDKILQKIIEPVAKELHRYVHIQSRFLVNLEAELSFYLAGVDLVERMRAAGLPTCRVEIAPLDERAGWVADLYNLDLALRLSASQPVLGDVVVRNEVRFGDEGRILILTGPNQGGKTTYVQAVGLAQVLFQVGYRVPGSAARVSPADRILTHFPLEEKPQAGAGRLGEEAQRLESIFRAATNQSLVLLNESLTTTSPGESVYLARDILRALRLWGVRAIFVTHLHELAEDISALEASTPGDSRFASLVAGIEQDDPAADAASLRRTYRIHPGPPMGLSYARDIARRHGISFDQLEDMKRKESRE
jgi:DNA mismatch repair protein MutS